MGEVKTYSIVISLIPTDMPPNEIAFIKSNSRIYSYLWERVRRTAGSAIGGQDRNGRTGSHLEGLMTFVVGVELCC